VLQWIARIFVSTYWSYQAFVSGVDDYCRRGTDPPSWLPALGMLGVHAIVLVALTLYGLRPAGRQNGGR